MKLNEKLYGFKVTKEEKISEMSATLYHLTHEKSGARLAFLDRQDTNKTFAIAFPTLPEDDTGVFHIIEHSVLCGSEKFPVKEPFVELLKGSLNTYLNALTYEDRTVYPVSSRCDADFYNLTNIYLDAVFNPKMKTNPLIFRQEGWHLERAEDGRLSYNGVVYNEMKGAYSSPEELGFSALEQLLFEGTPYGKDSGGKPSAIPTLTYEGFLAAHEKYYHPSNAYIFLDGEVKLSEILPLIDSYLSKYERREMNLSYPHNAVEGERSIRLTYAAAEGEEARSILYLGYVFGSFNESLKLSATGLLCDVLAGSNDAPLKKAILDSGLAEDVSVYPNRAKMQTIVIEIRGIYEKDAPKLKELVEKTIRNLASEGISKERLSATLGRIEFKLREADYGTFPRGVATALSVFGVWTYGGEVREALCYEDTLAELYSLIETDFFENMLLEATLDSPSRAAVLLVPDSEAEKEREADERASLDRLERELSSDELSALLRESERLAEWQAREDSPEALATIPALKISDLSPISDRVQTQDVARGGARILLPDIDTAGIVYSSFYFNVSDLNERELSMLSLLSTVLTNLPTESYSPEELKNEIKANLGSFSLSAIALSKVDGSGAGIPVIALTASSLPSKKDSLPRLIAEVLTKSDFGAKDIIEKLIIQLRSLADEAITSGADSIVRPRVEAMTSVGGALNEYLTGLEFLKFIKSLAREYHSCADEISSELSELAKRVFTRSRLTVSVAGENNPEYIDSLLEPLPLGEMVKLGSNISPLPARREWLATPAAVSHTTLGITANKARELLGTLRVVRSILSYEYLWNAVRVRGGAYGTGFITRRTGYVAMHSYRDPSPLASLRVFEGASEYLRQLAKSRTDLTKFIIGAIGEYDLLYTPRTLASQNAADVMTGWSYEKECALREDMINTTHEDLLRVADLLDEVIPDAPACIAAPKAMLDGDDSVFAQIRV